MPDSAPIKAAWLIDLMHSTGTVYAATCDLTDAGHETATGHVYIGICKSTDLSVTTQLEDGIYGVVIPSTVAGVRFTARVLNRHTQFYTTYIDSAEEWRETPIKIRHYDFQSGVLTTEFEGEIVDADFCNGDVVFTFQSVGSRILDILIPTVVVDAYSFPTATDVGAAIPVVFGQSTMVKPPYVGKDETASTTDPGGNDYLVSWGDKCRILTAWGDVDTDQSGLESMTSGWVNAPGTPTYASAATFTVTGGGSLDWNYPNGLPIRYKSTASPSAYVYNRITDHTSGTITVAIADLDAGLTGVQIIGDFLIEVGRYSIDGTDLTSLRVHAEIAGGLIVGCRDAQNTGNTPYVNPVEIVQQILTDTQWGLGQTVNTTSFSTAAAAVTALWSAFRIDWALGWDGRQRKARDVLNELLSFVEGVLTYDAATKEWSIVVQMSAPSAATLTFGYNDGYYNNIKQVRSNALAPARDAVSTLHLRFCPAGRSTGVPNFVFHYKDYQYTISKTVLGVGTPRVRTTEMIRDIASAKQVLDRWSKRLLYGDRKPVFVCGEEARTVTLGKLVGYNNVIDGINESVQVYRKETRLDLIVLYTMGYNAAIYTDTSSGIATPDTVVVDESTEQVTTARNLLWNPDFSTGVRSGTVPNGTQDTTSVPGIQFHDTNSMMSAGAVVSDYLCIGNAYLSITVAGSDEDIDTYAPRMEFLNTLIAAGTSPIGFPVVPGERYIVSVYSPNTCGFKLTLRYFRPGFTATSHALAMRVNGADTNGNGWHRYYGVDRVPDNAAYVNPLLTFLTADTYKFDAAQFELATRYVYKPTVWKHAVHSGIATTQINPGELAVRPSATDPDMYERIYTRQSVATALTGASVNVLGTDTNPLFPAGCDIRAVRIVVTGTITFAGGGSAYNVGTDIFPEAWGQNLTYTVIGTGSDGADQVAGGPIHLQSATHLTIAADAGTFAGGEIRAIAYLREYTRPTS
jgi:hypothetical protein